MFNSSSPSVADIAAVMRGNNNNSGWGNSWGGDGWWVLIIILALFGGFGNGWGGSGAQQGTQAEVQRGFDTQTIVSKLDGISNGICSLGYDQLAQINGINNNITTMGYGMQNSMQQMAMANMQSTNDLSRQLGDCCCENRQAIAQVRYDMASNTCAITNAINQMTQTIVQNDNANYRALHDEMVAARIAAKDEQIANLTARLNACDRDNALQGTASYIISRVAPTAVPAYPVANPNAPFTVNGGQPVPVQVLNQQACCQQYQ